MMRSDLPSIAGLRIAFGPPKLVGGPTLLRASCRADQRCRIGTSSVSVSPWIGIPYRVRLRALDCARRSWRWAVESRKSYPVPYSSTHDEQRRGSSPNFSIPRERRACLRKHAVAG